MVACGGRGLQGGAHALCHVTCVCVCVCVSLKFSYYIQYMGVGGMPSYCESEQFQFFVGVSKLAIASAML